MVLVYFGVAGLIGLPILLAAALLVMTRQRLSTGRGVAWQAMTLTALLAWQLLPLFYLSGLQQATAGEGDYWLLVCGALFGLVLICWQAGRLMCRIGAVRQAIPVFEPRRSAAPFAALYACAFGVFVLTRDTRWSDWLEDWVLCFVGLGT